MTKNIINIFIKFLGRKRTKFYFNYRKDMIIQEYWVFRNKTYFFSENAVLDRF
jgi:hypothetical protein